MIDLLLDQFDSNRILNQLFFESDREIPTRLASLIRVHNRSRLWTLSDLDGFDFVLVVLIFSFKNTYFKTELDYLIVRISINRLECKETTVESAVPCHKRQINYQSFCSRGLSTVAREY